MGSTTAMRLLVKCRRAALDNRLAEGADISADPALQLRAGQLCDLRARSRLSDTLVGLVGMAYEHPLPSESPRLDREAIIETRLLLLDLAGRLRSDPDVDALGVARATRLVEDPSGPLYVSDGSARTLAGETRAAIAGLD